MSRILHRRVGLIGAVFGILLAMTGAFLALEPLSEASRTGSLTSVTDVNLAVLSDAITDQISGVERIEKSANHTVWVHFTDADGFGKVAFDPVTLAPIPSDPKSPIWSNVKDFHRSLFLGDFGRGVVGVTALSMLVLTITGLTMMIRRMGGWRALIAPPKTGKAHSLHLDMGRFAALGLLCVAMTGVWMSLATFEIVPSSSLAYSAFPTIDAMQNALPIGDLTALQNTPLAALREMVLPYPNDPTDVFTLTTNHGSGFVDPTTGQLINFAPHGFAARAYDFIYLLHTGQGAWWVGLLLGLSMLAVPVVTLSGLAMALRRPRTGKRQIKSLPANIADTIVLVGSEGATTWGFAAELCRKLTAAGKRVHVADMNDLATTYPAADNMLILSATYGQGEAPANATRFLDRVQHLAPHSLNYAVLGFGDRTFPQFCAFAETVDSACDAQDLRPLVAFTSIDRQSSQSFQAWGHKVALALGIDLDLDHVANPPVTLKVTVHDRIDYGQEVQAPVSIIRLRALHGKLPQHAPGDLLGVVVDGSDVPRFYSLASSHKDGFIEICVRRQNGGLVSGQLTSIVQGDTVDVFIKSNPSFRPNKSKAPLVLIGAGAGIGPLMGFARANAPSRDASLFWGGRDAGSDFLYQDELSTLKKAGRLSRVTTAFSRSVEGAYVQEKLRASASELRRAIQLGGQVMVCGGAAMGADVRRAWDEILAPIGLSVQHLKTEERYLEDVY